MPLFSLKPDVNEICVPQLNRENYSLPRFVFMTKHVNSYSEEKKKSYWFTTAVSDNLYNSEHISEGADFC